MLCLAPLAWEADDILGCDALYVLQAVVVQSESHQYLYIRQDVQYDQWYEINDLHVDSKPLPY